jgi:hypothetical protein
MGLLSERVNVFLTEQAPLAFCDECITEELELSGRPQAHHAIIKLATTKKFHRAHGVCSACGQARLVIRHA